MFKYLLIIIVFLTTVKSSLGQASLVLVQEQKGQLGFPILKKAYVLTPVGTPSDTTWYTVKPLEMLLHSEVPLDTIGISRNEGQFIVCAKQLDWSVDINYAQREITLSVFEENRLVIDQLESNYAKDTSVDTKGVYVNHRTNKWLGWRVGNDRFVVLAYFPLDKIITSYRNKWEKKALLPSEMTKIYTVANFRNNFSLVEGSQCYQFSYATQMQGKLSRNEYRLSLSPKKVPFDGESGSVNEYVLTKSNNMQSLTSKIDTFFANTDSFKYVIQWIEPLYLDGADTIFVAYQWSSIGVESVTASATTVGNTLNRAPAVRSVQWSKGIAVGPVNSFVYGIGDIVASVWEVKASQGAPMHLLTERLPAQDYCSQLVRLFRDNGRIVAEVLVAKPCELRLKRAHTLSDKNKSYRWSISEKGIYLLDLGEAEKDDDFGDIEFLEIFGAGTPNTVSSSFLYENLKLLNK